MPSSNKSRRFLEQREADRKHRREEERRAAANERRVEDERARERQEQRQLEARREWQHVESILDAARQRREMLLMQLRARKQEEQQETERRDHRSAGALNELRAVRQSAERNTSRPAERPEAEDKKPKSEIHRSIPRERFSSKLRRQDRVPEQKPPIKRLPMPSLEEKRPARAPVPDGKAKREKPKPSRVVVLPRRAEPRNPVPKSPKPRIEREGLVRPGHDAKRRERPGLASIEIRKRPEREENRAPNRLAANKRNKPQTALRVARSDSLRSAQREDRLVGRVATRKKVEGRLVRDEPRAVRQKEIPEANRTAVQGPSLEDRIPTGMLSAALPWLRVRGNRTVTLGGDSVILRGIGLLGLESALPDPELGFAKGAGITPKVLDALLACGGNLIRLAVDPVRVREGAGNWTAADYLSDLDWIIQRAAAHHAYTLLSARTANSDSGTQAGQRNLEAWRFLSERYAAEPAVLFDLCGGPWPEVNSDWMLWSSWIEIMVAEIRQVHPRALCFVCGVNGGFDLAGFPTVSASGDPIPNLVYAARLSPEVPAPLSSIRSLASRHPVFVSEWGGSRTSLLWGEQIARNLRASGIGWAAAHWNREPALTRDPAQVAPTAFGTLVLRELRMVGEPLLAGQPAVL